jgi:hypothetical protein
LAELSLSSFDSRRGKLNPVDLAAKQRSHLAQSQLFPQLHSLLSFMGQFLPVFLQVGLSAAKDTVQTAATRIENRIFV